MSRVTLVLARITCDTDGCTASYPANDWATDISVAWQQARRAGWERDCEQDRCPDHAPTAPVVARVRELAGAGMGDGRIGGRVGLARGQVQYLRRTHGIAAGQRPGRPRTGAAGGQADRRME
jgi:hypothetical protein